MTTNQNEPNHLPWLKMYSREWLQGSLRIDNTPAERGLWADLLALANESRNRGVIQANVDIAYPHPYLAGLLNIDLDFLEEGLKKFHEQRRLIENEAGITILNFEYYQGLGVRPRGRPKNVRPGQLPLEPFPRFTGTEDKRAEDLWNKALTQIEKEASLANYRTWFSETKGMSFADHIFVVGAPNDFIAEYLSQNQCSLIEKNIMAIVHEDITVNFVVYEKKGKTR